MDAEEQEDDPKGPKTIFDFVTKDPSSKSKDGCWRWHCKICIGGPQKSQTSTARLVTHLEQVHSKSEGVSQAVAAYKQKAKNRKNSNICKPEVDSQGKRQAPLEPFMAQAAKNDLNTAIAQYVISSGAPLSIYDNQDFQTLVNTIADVTRRTANSTKLCSMMVTRETARNGYVIPTARDLVMVQRRKLLTQAETSGATLLKHKR